MEFGLEIFPQPLHESAWHARGVESAIVVWAAFHPYNMLKFSLNHQHDLLDAFVKQ